MIRLLSRLARLLSAGLLLAAADAPPADIVAQRGDIALTVAQAHDALNQIDPAQRAQVLANPSALAAFVRDRLLRQVLLAEARDAKWDQNKDVIARIEDAKDSVIVQTWLSSRVQLDPNYPSEAEIATAYETNKARFAVPKQYHLQQIAILVAPGASKDVDDAAHKKALDLRQQALKPKADFAALAKKSSEDRLSADRGGDLDWVREDQIVPGVQEVVQRMAMNTISEPVRSSEAWHVLKLLGTRPASFLPLEQVKASIIYALRQARAQQAMKEYVDALVRKQPAQINEVGLADRLNAEK